MTSPSKRQRKRKNYQSFRVKKLKSNSFARNKKITVMKKRMLLAAICSVILSVGIANAQPREGRSSGHTRSEIHHSPAPAPKPIAKVNHKPAPVPPPPAPRHHAHHRPAPVPPPPPAPRHHAHHRPAPVPPPPAPVPAPAPRVAYVASPVATAATVAGVAVVAGLLGAAIASR